MRFLITSVSGKKGYKSFKNLNEYVEFMTKKGHLVKDLKEADLPYTDKPVKLPKVSKSNGWSEVTDFGEVGEEAEKGESLIASTSKSVMKDEASFEMSKSSGKADKPEMGLGAEKGDVDMSDFKSFEYEEPKLKSSETKESAPKSEEPKSEEISEPKKEDKKDSNKSSKKEEKKDESKKHDKDIEECLKAAGVQLNEFFKFDADNSGEDDSNEKFIEELRQEVHSLRSNSLFIRACVKALKKLGGNGGFGADRQSRQSIERFINEVNKLIRKYTSKSEYTASSSTLNGLCEFIDSLPYEQSSKIIDDLIQVVYNNCDSHVFNLICDEVAYASRYGKINESIKDYLPRAGFIRDDDEDKDSGKMGIWGGQGTDDEIRKAKIIAKVKFANGNRMGGVTGEDLKHFDDYKRQYDEIYGSNDELNEGWKDKFKKGAATLGVAASLAGNAMANEPSNRYEFNDEDLKYQMMDANDCEFAKSACPKDFYKKNKDDNNTRIISKKDGYYVDQYGNKLGVVDDFDETEDERLDADISECLKAAGVQLNEFFHFDGPDPDDESKESDDEKTYKKYMKKEISDDEARSELKKQGYKGKKAKNLVKNAKSKRDSK